MNTVYRWVVIWLGEGGQTPEVHYYQEREDAEVHYRQLAANWSGVQLAEVLQDGSLQWDQQPTVLPDSDGARRRAVHYYKRDELSWRVTALERILQALARRDWARLMQVDEMYQSFVDRIAQGLRRASPGAPEGEDGWDD